MLTTYRERTLGAGDLDRRVTLLTRALTRDPVYGAQEAGWVDGDTVWAKVEESATAGELQARDGQATHARPHRVTMRWRAGVTTDMRLRLNDGRILEILGTAALGRGKWLELSCVEWRHQQP